MPLRQFAIAQSLAADHNDARINRKPVERWGRKASGLRAQATTAGLPGSQCGLVNDSAHFIGPFHATPCIGFPRSARHSHCRSRVMQSSQRFVGQAHWFVFAAAVLLASCDWTSNSSDTSSPVKTPAPSSPAPTASGGPALRNLPPSTVLGNFNGSTASASAQTLAQLEAPTASTPTASS